MGYDWLNHTASYPFYLECKRLLGLGVCDDPTDDEVATYCMGGEL